MCSSRRAQYDKEQNVRRAPSSARICCSLILPRPAYSLALGTQFYLWDGDNADTVTATKAWIADKGTTAEGAAMGNA